MILRKHATGAIALLAALFVSGAAIANAPFGFDAGTHPTEYDFCSLDETGYTYTCTNAPKPHGNFESYILLYMDGIGFCKTTAIGKTINGDGYGEKKRRIVDKIARQIARRYGPETHKYDMLRPEETPGHPSNWTYEIRQDYRRYEYLWSEGDGYKPVNDIRNIIASIEVVSGNRGRVDVEFEFGTMPRCKRAIDDAESDVF